jgi:hypothetical protein
MPKQINNNKPHRSTEANQVRTQDRINTYLGKNAIRLTWETCASERLQEREHNYLLGLRKRVRENKNFLMNRADAQADV